MSQHPGTDASTPRETDAAESVLLPETHPLRSGRTSGAPLVLAARRRPVPHTPVWFMRQAGRSLPEYRAVRAGVPMLESCFRTDLIVEITLQPVRRLGVDAAIFFSDIVVPLKAIGIDLDIVPGVGPVVAEPFRTAADVDRLRDLTAEDVAPVLAAVTELAAQLGGTPADRLRRCPVHAGVVPRRGRPEPGPRAHQGAHVRRP